ncbi:hypothetical protein [Variovorax sp. PBL-H6]|nr:hypothetical protein [Variovorax sp. PBL-H6]
MKADSRLALVEVASAAPVMGGFLDAGDCPYLGSTPLEIEARPR